jgi:hypothetical protein
MIDPDHNPQAPLGSNANALKANARKCEGIKAAMEGG